MSELKVGDVCDIVAGGGIRDYMVGLECTIIGPLQDYDCIDHSGQYGTLFGFQCEVHGEYPRVPGALGACIIRPENLRKRRPPSWENVEQVTGWRPVGVSA